MSKSALVVDDSKSARFALRKFLEGFNYKVETVEGANEAYRILGGNLPDVIFLDHIMPGIDGFEALRVIKADPRTSTVPVVICSSNEGEDFITQAKARGASDVLQKPPSPEQLAGVLANLVNRNANYTATLPPSDESHPLAATLAPTLMPRREPTAMERLMATIPPKMIPTAHLLSSLQPIPAPSPAPTAPVAAPVTAATLQGVMTATIPLAVTPVTPPKVQSLREPAVTIQQAVMKSIRDSMPSALPPQPAAPAAAVTPPLPVVPSLTGGEPDTSAALVSLREELDARLQKLRQEVVSELSGLRGQIAAIDTAALDEKIRVIASEAAKARTNALASSLEQHLSALRGNLGAVLRAQNERIEQLLNVSRQTAAEEAERTVMKAAQRISDQMAESILKTLGPQLASMRRMS